MNTIINQFYELTAPSVKGTIIDFETIGEFNQNYNSGDPKHYSDILPVIFGTFERDCIQIFYIKNKNQIPELIERMKVKLQELTPPLYAFNHKFERCIIYNQLMLEVEFKELQRFPFEKKEKVCKDLCIPDYEDPYNGNGRLCMEAWLKGNYEDCIKHNRSCLLKEADILRIRWNDIRDPEPTP